MESNLFDLTGYNPPQIISNKIIKISWAEKAFIFKRSLFVVTDILLSPILFVSLDTKIAMIIMFIITVFVNYSFLVLYRTTGKGILKIKKSENDIGKAGILVRIMKWISNIKLLYRIILFCTESFVFIIEVGNEENNYSIRSFKIFFLFIFSTIISSLLSNILGKSLAILWSLR